MPHGAWRESVCGAVVLLAPPEAANVTLVQWRGCGWCGVLAGSRQERVSRGGVRSLVSRAALAAPVRGRVAAWGDVPCAPVEALAPAGGGRLGSMPSPEPPASPGLSPSGLVPRALPGRHVALMGVASPFSVPLCGGFAAVRGGADSGHVQKAPQSGGAALRAALTAVRCGSGRSRRPTGCWSPLRGSDEMPRGSGRGSPRGERLASPAGSFIDVACIPGAAATAAEGAAADRASRKAFRR